MGGPVFSSSVEGVDVGKGYGVYGESRRGGRGMVGRSANSVVLVATASQAMACMRAATKAMLRF